MSNTVSNYIRRHHLALVALFFALGGGAAWATHPGGENTISSADIIDNEVRSADIRDANLTTSDIRADAVTTGKIKNDEVQSIDVKDGDITGVDVKDDSVTGADIIESSVGRVGDSERLEGIARPDLADGVQSAGGCNPASSTFITCRQVTLPGRPGDQFLAIASIEWHADAFGARGQCALHNLGFISQVRLGETEDTTDAEHPGGATTVALGTLAGADTAARRLTLQCKELESDLRISGATLTAVTLP